MSGQDEDSDKQYEPTQKKLDDARKKGELPKSTDLTTAAGYGGFLIAALAFGPGALKGLGTTLSGLLDRADSLSSAAFSGTASPLVGSILIAVPGAILPWLLLPTLLALISVVAQRALVFAPSKLAFKVSRISLLSNFKQKFGRSGLFEFAKSFVKLLLYSTVLGAYLWHQMPRILGTLALPPAMIAAELGRLCLGLMFIVLAIALTIGGIDLIWQRAEHLRKNRMSRKELTDEFKQSEGDPMMKQQRRQKAIEIAMNQMLAEVPGADVVIVNPTHFAVALKWDPAQGRAPVCVAKGVDEIAARIREIAAENAIPIHSDPPTARALHASVEIGDEIRPDHYRAVAAAIRFAESIRKKVRKK